MNYLTNERNVQRVHPQTSTQRILATSELTKIRKKEEEYYFQDNTTYNLEISKMIIADMMNFNLSNLFH